MLTSRGDSYFFRETRYQTGETEEIITEMKNGKIPCVDVDNQDELDWYIEQLKKHGIYRIDGLACDRKARDGVKEPDFECRIAFFTKPVKAGEIKPEYALFIDFYFEPEIEETYDSIGEI